MPNDAPLPDSYPDDSALAIENRALRAENRQHRASQTDTDSQQARRDDYDLSQARFRTVFENAPLGQKIIVPDLTIRQANQAMADMLGYPSPAALVGHPILDFTHPDHVADWHFLQERLWTHKTPSFVLETRLVRADGSVFWCQVVSILFPDAGTELGYTILEDITDRKELEITNKRLYDAQETILHLVAHDLKSPIANIQLLADLVERERGAPALTPPEPSEIPHFVDLIRQSCAEAFTLLNDVLFLGKLDAQRLQKRPVDLGAFLDGRLAVHRMAAREKGIALALALPTAPVQANIDSDQFGRVLDNLLSNALKFTPAEGHIAVSLSEHAGQPRITVADSGIGIPVALQDQVFDKFNPASRAGLGGEVTTGLGLFIARQIVRLHGGQLGVESDAGLGTRFIIDLA